MPRYDMYVDVTGVDDVILSDTGDFTFTSTIREALAQRLAIKLRTLQGEWAFNTELGIPLKRIMSGEFNKQELDALYTAIIIEDEDVTAVKELTSVIDPYTRKYEIKSVEVYCNDEALDIPVASATKRLNEASTPYTIEDFKVCTLTPEELAEINKLYHWINYTLYEEGDNTWWQKW